MERSGKLSTLILLALLLPVTVAQTQSPEIFSPFVSSLRAREAEGGVILTWRDSPDVLESYHIFRHTKEISGENFSDAVEIGTVPPGTSTYTDYPDQGGDYFYLVLLENPEEGLYDLFIPFRNKTVFPVTVSGVVTEEELSAEISGIGAEVRGDSVRISFDTSRGDRSLTIYRHSSPIDSVDQLLEASRIALIESDVTGYTDYPIPGIQYYYGIFDTRLIQTGTFQFFPKENITTEPVKIASTPDRTGLKTPATSLRSPPLPRIMLQRGIISGTDLIEPLALIMPQRTGISPETSMDVASLLSSLPHKELPPMEPSVLPEHINGEYHGAAYTLSLILREQFLKGDFASTAESLESFLSIDRQERVDIAARYYLGQAYFFTGKYRDAFYELLVAEEDYYPEVQPWIERIYTILMRDVQSQ